MPKKSFTAYAPTEGSEFDVNGRTFHLNPFVPGEVLLDFTSKTGTDDPAALAAVVRDLLDAAIVAEELADWHAFARDPANGVSMTLLAEIAGFVAEAAAGNAQAPQPVPYGPG